MWELCDAWEDAIGSHFLDKSECFYIFQTFTHFLILFSIFKTFVIPIDRYRNNGLSNLFILLGSLNNPDLKSLQFVIVCSYLSLTDSFEAPIISRISKIQRRLQTWNQWLSSESCGLNICLIVKISPRTFAYSSSRVILFVLHEKYWMLIAVPINRHQNVKKVSFF